MNNGSNSPVDAEVTYRDVADRRCSTRLKYGSWITRPGDLLPVRSATDLKTSTELLQKILPADPSRLTATATELLENEARIAYRLGYRYRDAYPRELMRLVGHNLDADEPFVLYAMPRGRPVAERSNLRVDEIRALYASLLRAGLVLADGQVIHGNLTPETLWWDGQHVQIGDFAVAALPGEISKRRPLGRWASPEQREGAPASFPDDIWSIGALIYYINSGREPQIGTEPSLNILGPALAGQLAGIFAPSPAERPHIRALLNAARVSADSLTGTAPDSGPAYQNGLDAFDRVLNEKRAAIPPVTATPVVPAPPPPPEMRPGWLRRRTPSLMLVLAQLLLNRIGS